MKCTHCAKACGALVGCARHPKMRCAFFFLCLPSSAQKKYKRKRSRIFHICDMKCTHCAKACGALVGCARHPKMRCAFFFLCLPSSAQKMINEICSRIFHIYDMKCTHCAKACGALVGCARHPKMQCAFFCLCLPSSAQKMINEICSWIFHICDMKCTHCTKACGALVGCARHPKMRGAFFFLCLPSSAKIV